MDKRFVKKCRVCGDKALSFNFNGLCCESCKIFFRRNALKYDSFKCFYNGTCTIDLITRKNCQLCRLNKCLAIGMRMDMIVSKGSTTKSNDFSASTTSQGAAQCRSSILTGANVLLSELLLQPLDVVEFSEGAEEERRIQDTAYKRIKIENSQENNEGIEVGVQIEDALKHRGTCTNIPIPSQSSKVSSQSNSNLSFLTGILKPYESHCLELIKKATLLLPEAAPPMKGLQIVGYATNLAQMFNNQESQIQNMLTFVNTIEGFQSLLRQDQLIVFKKAFPEILLLHSAFFFNFEKNACLVPMNQFYAIYIKLDGLYFGANSETPIRLHRLLAFRIKEEMENDVIIRELASVLLMFTPKDTISCPEYIRHQYFSYSHLLRRYLQLKYHNPRKANKKFCKIKQIVHDIGSFKYKLYDVVSQNLDYTKVSDVLSEIYFPVKQHHHQQPPPVEFKPDAATEFNESLCFT